MHGETLSQHCPLLGKLYHAPAWFTPGPRIRGSDSSARAGKAAGRLPTWLTFRPGLMPEFPGLHPRRIEWNNLLLEPGICFHEEAPCLVLIMGCRVLSLPFRVALQTELVDEVSCTGLYLLLFSCSVVSDSLWPRGLQRARPPYPLPSPGLHRRLLWSWD